MCTLAAAATPSATLIAGWRKLRRTVSASMRRMRYRLSNCSTATLRRCSRPYVADATDGFGVVLFGRPWQRGADCPPARGDHGATFPAFCCGALAQSRQDHAHVRPRGRKRVPALALARHRRQTSLSRLRLHDLLRVPAIGSPSTVALQGVPW